MSIEGNVTTSKPRTLEEAINIAQRLMDQTIKYNSTQDTNDHKRKFDDRNTTNNNNYPNDRNNNYQNNHNKHNHNNDHHQQQNKKQKTFKTYVATNGLASAATFTKMGVLHPSLDITLSVLPITLIDHLFESPSPPSPPPLPHPSIMVAETDENTTNPQQVPPTPKASHTLSTIKLHILKKGVSTEDANQKFLRSLPSSWSQVSLIIRTKPGVDTLNFDDLYNNLKVFESDVKRSTGSSSSTQNVAFVSSDNTSSSSLYTDDLMYSFFANQSSGPQLDHKDLKQVDEFDLEEMDLKWQVDMISIRLKKFYKKTRRKLHFDAKEPVGFDKSKVECFNCHNTGHFTRECISKGNQDSRRRDVGNTIYKARDNGKRHAKQDEHKAMVTIDGEGVDWTGNPKDDIEDYALMAFNSSNFSSDTKVTSCLKVCEESYAKLKKLYDEQREQLGNYMPPKSNFRIDESKFSYGPKLSTPSKSGAKTSDLDSCESSSSEETLENVPTPIESKPKVINEPKVWTDAPIIEKYESDSDYEHVTIPSKEQEKPNFAFVNTIEHVKTP
nr:hypothetical protein [Tanacetum cinerariifolium]